MSRRLVARSLGLWTVRGALVCSLGWGPLPSLVQAAPAAQASEASIKAAYLHKFLPYVEWPADALPAPDTPLVIAIAGADAVLAELRLLLAGRTVNGHAVQARRWNEDEPALDGVHAVFVGQGTSLQRVLLRARSRPVLVVTETRNALDVGAMLNFVLVDGRVRFEAAPAVAERAGLKLSARLLGVAERVVAR